MLSELILELCEFNKEKRCGEISDIIYGLGVVRDTICNIMISTLLTDEEKIVILKRRLEEDIKYYIESNELDIDNLDLNYIEIEIE